jgi:hypothetical protein
MYIHIHTYINTYIHTYTYIHTGTTGQEHDRTGRTIGDSDPLATDSGVVHPHNHGYDMAIRPGFYVPSSYFLLIQRIYKLFYDCKRYVYMYIFGHTHPPTHSRIMLCFTQVLSGFPLCGCHCLGLCCRFCLSLLTSLCCRLYVSSSSYDCLSLLTSLCCRFCLSLLSF